MTTILGCFIFLVILGMVSIVFEIYIDSQDQIFMTNNYKQFENLSENTTKNKSNDLLEEAQIRKIEFDLYIEKLNLYLNSFDENVEKDSLEIDEYDLNEELNYFSKFKEEMNKYDQSTGGIDGRWQQEKFYLFVSKLRDENFEIEDKDKLILAFEKFVLRKKINFGKKLGRSNDRYDYFMYLKCGADYKAKYISQEELIKILKENKYGFSKHLILD